MPHKLYETEERQKRALLVSINSGKKDENDAALGRELRGLAETLELEILGHELVRVRDRQPQFGMGSGKAEELAEKAAQLEADCLIFDWDPSPSQQRNWENLAGIPVIDRQELIIKIFAARAATREADLQVRLAELHYRLPRLAHKYIDLSRQRGGRYGTKGTGETRLETDRRQIEQRIHKLEKEIDEIAKQRQVQRRQRERQGLPACAIVGYTNAGKSSLLNALTGSAVLVEDKLFATLDAATRRFEPVPGMAALLTDTVGFIRRLPHSLIKAFRSTLEEAAHASLLIHVLDASDPAIENCYRTTIAVLQELGAGEIPVITVLNKVDLLSEPPLIETLLAQYPESYAVSIKNGSGLDELKNHIGKKLLHIARNH
ncbi:MAG: GTPase HflX [Treponema sp.]|jgi:GTP-binding protein HflX|nr:GTPase HflX [Treponema sp.]